MGLKKECPECGYVLTTHGIVFGDIIWVCKKCRYETKEKDTIENLPTSPVSCELAGSSTVVVGSLSVDKLLWGALHNAKPRECGEAPRWVAVRDTFAVGSTSAHDLCRENGLDPEELVCGPRCLSCHP